MIIHLCQGESGAVHLQADDGPVWDLGDALNPDAYAVDAAAWVHGDWAPSEPLGWTSATPDGLTRVASWSQDEGLVLHVAPEHLGAAAQQYIGQLPAGPLPTDRRERCATLVDEWWAANAAVGDDPVLRADDEALRARYDDIQGRYLPQIQALGYAVLMQGYHPCRVADKVGGQVAGRHTYTVAVGPEAGEVAEYLRETARARDVRGDIELSEGGGAVAFGQPIYDLLRSLSRDDDGVIDLDGVAEGAVGVMWLSGVSYQVRRDR